MRSVDLGGWPVAISKEGFKVRSDRSTWTSKGEGLGFTTMRGPISDLTGAPGPGGFGGT